MKGYLTIDDGKAQTPETVNLMGLGLSQALAQQDFPPLLSNDILEPLVWPLDGEGQAL
jgi:hypothetical protein